MKQSATTEDYLRVMYRLQEDGLKTLRSTDIAKHLGLGKSTISERLADMARRGLVSHQKYADLTLTTKGYAIAKNLTYKHRILEVFLHDTLGLPASRVHKEAHELEHAISDEVITRLAQFLHNPKKDAHGKKIPKRT